jgi:hypothetical protein
VWFGAFYSFWYPSWFYEFPLQSFVPPGEAGPAFSAGAPTGGLQLDVEPRRAQVYVDGTYAGVVDDFAGYYRHLDLPAGPHRIDIVLDRYQPQTIGVVVSPGRTTTYRGTLTWAAGR